MTQKIFKTAAMENINQLANKNSSFYNNIKKEKQNKKTLLNNNECPRFKFQEESPDRKPGLAGSQDVAELLKKSKIILHSSVQIQPISARRTERNPKKLAKTLSLNTQSSDNSILNQSNPAQKYQNDSLYREKLKILIQKNQDALLSPESQKKMNVQNSDKKMTLKKLMKLQKQKSRSSLMATIEAIKNGKQYKKKQEKK